MKERLFMLNSSPIKGAKRQSKKYKHLNLGHKVLPTHQLGLSMGFEQAKETLLKRLKRKKSKVIKLIEKSTNQKLHKKT